MDDHRENTKGHLDAVRGWMGSEDAVRGRVSAQITMSLNVHSVYSRSTGQMVTVSDSSDGFHRFHGQKRCHFIECTVRRRGVHSTEIAFVFSVSNTVYSAWIKRDDLIQRMSEGVHREYTFAR